MSCCMITVVAFIPLMRGTTNGASGQLSWPDKYLVGHMAEMHRKWLMASCYFYLCKTVKESRSILDSHHF